MRWLFACVLFSCGGAAGPAPATLDPTEESATPEDTTDAWTNPCSTLFCTRPPHVPAASTPGQYAGSLCGCVEQRGCVEATVGEQPQLEPFADRLGCGAWPQYPRLFDDQLPK